jgi:solute:Na+ symporter, SSS family
VDSEQQMDAAQHHHLTSLDWSIIIGYALGMLAVGWYYSRRSSTTNDYLLGGRQMRPTAVGLSLFATLLSSVSYLAIPGEMIKYGPMILAQMATYPVIVLVVGWLIIPLIMRLKVTSAYEILELRLGISVRLLGAFLFLFMRLLWMAVIVYATSSKVLIPLSGLNPSATTPVCIVIGIITVAYTSMGGLRAVVMTDVIQTLILFTGAIVALLVITVNLGGVGQWFPRSWLSTWQQPQWFDPTARISFLSAVIAPLTWYICTSGSDQLAIQRYLATRDVRSARRVLVTSLVAEGLVTVFLAMLGFALLAWFVANPHLLPAGQSITGDADQLFPTFIVSGLHHGFSGLVVAGLLAAAMSSLSAGINASCSVVVVDFVDRVKFVKLSQSQHMHLTRRISWLVGTVVIGLSAAVGLLRGNLLEIGYRVVNLFVAPLFVLFAMALFIPWATTCGTLIGALCSIATAFQIDFWREIYGGAAPSFQWIMPVSLLVGLVTGMLGSLLPIGKRRPMLECREDQVGPRTQPQSPKERAALG